METLAILLGGQSRVKIMRLFLFNKEAIFTTAQASARVKVSEAEVKKEVVTLQKAGLIKRKNIFVTVIVKRGKKQTEVKKRDFGYYLNLDFVYLSQLQNLLIGSRLLKNESLIKRLSKAGKLKMVILAGVFIQDWTSRVDLFIVADNIKKGTLENTIKSIEAEIGKELTYTAFETTDFKYRLGMCDKLVRDVLDYPHQTIHDKIGEMELKK